MTRFKIVVVVAYSVTKWSFC